QEFNVLFFSDFEVIALSKANLVMATPANKLKAYELSDKMAAAGSTDPMPAIRMAFEQKPELIYVLTDGFENVVSFDAVVNEFRRLNADKKVKVNTILIRSSASPDLEKVVRTIAAENGGICKIIDRQDLDKGQATGHRDQRLDRQGWLACPRAHGIIKSWIS